MTTLKQRIHNINETAQVEWERAQGMLDMLNDIYGTEYGWLCKRVVWSEAPKNHIADFYANCHDLEATL